MKRLADYLRCALLGNRNANGMTHSADCTFLAVMRIRAVPAWFVRLSGWQLGFSPFDWEMSEVLVSTQTG